jgi:DNA-binding NtrC family response regulator
VSRHHCVIRVTGDGFLITDLDSMNGIKLGGFRVREAFLKEKCSIRLGRVKLSFARVDGEVREKLSTTQQFVSMVGDSPPMRRLFARCRRVAPTERSILLIGEAGTGKRTLAEGIHAESPRADEPFVEIDLATIARSDLEPQLFGSDGAYRRAGKGTLYIASIGELPAELQEILFETFDEYDARLITGTDRDLRKSVNRGWFRADLYHRLAAVRLFIPPLRDRPADVFLLARHLHAALYPDRPAPQDDYISNRFGKRQWWGNVNALRAAIEREAGYDTDT